MEAVRVAWRDLDARLTAALGREALQHLTAGVYAAVQRLEGGDQS